jgi:hypothetical protein
MTSKNNNLHRLWVKISLFVITLGALSSLACVEDQPLSDPPLTDPEMRVYYDNYDEVWRAIQLTLRKYPVHLNNIESGLLETDYIKGDKLFADPVETRDKPGLRYKIVIRAIKGQTAGRSAVQVLCTKTNEVQKDFFTGYQPLPSNGLEEKTILYRIGRFLEMEKILTKASGTPASN